jgi:hypothetical protein
VTQARSGRRALGAAAAGGKVLLYDTFSGEAVEVDVWNHVPEIGAAALASKTFTLNVVNGIPPDCKVRPAGDIYRVGVGAGRGGPIWTVDDESAGIAFELEIKSIPAAGDLYLITNANMTTNVIGGWVRYDVSAKTWAFAGVGLAGFHVKAAPNFIVNGDVVKIVDDLSGTLTVFINDVLQATSNPLTLNSTSPRNVGFYSTPGGTAYLIESARTTQNA